jgi:hypothetical protein
VQSLEAVEEEIECELELELELVNVHVGTFGECGTALPALMSLAMRRRCVRATCVVCAFVR